MNDEHLNKEIELYEDGIGKVQLIQHYGTDLTIVNAARVSFGVNHKKLTGRDKKLIKYMIENKHTSVFEHCGVTFKFIVPLFVRSQHHRHRVWSFNEISRRYTAINMNFYEPKQFRCQSDSNRQASTNELINPEIDVSDYDWHGNKSMSYISSASLIVRKHHEKSLKLYNDLLSVGIAREQARGVLPQNTYTEYYGTCNLSNLFKFITLRLHEGAQWETQQVARACLTIAEELWPITVSAFREIVWESCK